jgi:galactose mutarotase-like enzyme
MGLWKAWLGNMEIGWRSPVRGPVHPRFVPLGEPSGLGWLDGFDELLVRCGLESNGAPEFDDRRVLKYPLHGRIANMPAHFVQLTADDDSGEITLAGAVDETRFLFKRLRLATTIKTRAQEPTLSIGDRVENWSASPAEAQLLYHINFGPPLLEEGARFVAPVKTVVPRNPRAAETVATWDVYGPPEAGFAEQVYFLELLSASDGGVQTLLKNAQGDRGVSLHFHRTQLPCFTLWKNTADPAEGYVTGLEPGVNFPNPRSFEAKQGRVAKLAPGGQLHCNLRLAVHENRKQVDQAEKDIAAIQAGVAPVVHKEPLEGWCAK